MSAYSCCGGYSGHKEACWSENSKREIAALKAELATERERSARLVAALESGLRGLVWYLEGPYGPSPSQADLDKVREALLAAKQDEGNGS